jgi:hypothetical protein
MHYRNGREAKNGDRIIQIGGDGKIQGAGILHGAIPGNDWCNGNMAVTAAPSMACLCDCLHAEDVEAMLKERGLDRRPEGK